MTELIAAVLLGIVKAISQNGKAVAEFWNFLQIQKGNEKRAELLDGITRGLQYAKETGDTSQLEKAIREHCGPNGCRIP